ncbi:MAG: M56 family metallopeptidase [Opitutaceae bacterium]|nr:M56 family metallopeptidase [Opitutaceae bacterium]
MNPLPLTEIFSAVTAMSWRAAWLIVVLVVLRLLVRGRIPAQIWFVAWIVVGVRLLVPFSISANWSPYNLTAVPVPANASPTLPTPNALDATAAPQLENVSTVLGVETVDIDRPVITAAAMVPEAPAWNRTEILAAFWLGGVVVLGLARAIESRRFRRRLARAHPADERVTAIAKREARLCGVTARVSCVETDAVDAPALFGLLRPRLLFPEGFAAQLADEDLRLVVRHELAHWRRRDLVAHALMQGAVALHWFNPFAWLAARLARTDCELACDEFVLRRGPVDGAHAYGSTLLRVLGVVRGRRRPGAVVAILEDKHQLAERVRMIADYRGTTMGRVLGGVMLIGLLAAASMTRETQAQERTAALSPRNVSEPVAAAAEAPAPVQEQTRAPMNEVEQSQTTLKSQQERVDELAQRVQRFKEQNQMASLVERKTILNDTLRTKSAVVERAGNALEAAETRLKQIEEQRARGADLTDLSFIGDRPRVDELKRHLIGQKLALVKLSQRYHERHPQHIAATKVLEETQRELDRAVVAACEQITAEHQLALRNYEQCEEELNKTKAEAIELDRTALGFRQLERELMTQSQMLQSIVARAREETRGTVAAVGGGAVPPAVRSPEPAAAPIETRPAAPHPTPAPTPSVTASSFTSVTDDSFQVSVVGAVNTQSAVNLTAREHPIVLDAIARAGGFTAKADRGAVRIIRSKADGSRETITLTEEVVMMGTDPASRVQRSDVIVVPEMPPPVPRFVHVVGAVNKPGRFPLPADHKMTVVELIANAGGQSRLADLKRVMITRINKQTQAKEVRTVNVDPLIKGSAGPGANSAEITLEPDDTVFVPERIL